jgi:hypothetical protein
MIVAEVCGQKRLAFLLIEFTFLSPTSADHVYQALASTNKEETILVAEMYGQNKVVVSLFLQY